MTFRDRSLSPHYRSVSTVTRSLEMISSSRRAKDTNAFLCLILTKQETEISSSILQLIVSCLILSHQSRICYQLIDWKPSLKSRFTRVVGKNSITLQSKWMEGKSLKISRKKCSFTTMLTVRTYSLWPYGERTLRLS